MPIRRYPSHDDGIEGVRRSVREEFGPAARIVRCERVTQSGIAGFLAQRWVEVEVEALPESEPSMHMRLGTADRVGIAALLAVVESVEDEQPPASTATGVALTTERDDFATVLASVTGGAGLDARLFVPGQDDPLPLRTPPVVRTGVAESPRLELASGDLALVVGLGRDGLDTARELARSIRAVDVRAGGSTSVRGSDPVENRRSALAARAHAVRRDRAVVVGYGLEGLAVPEGLAVIGADQVWAVVDASRSTSDTRLWLDAVRRRVPIDALAVIGRSFTVAPDGPAGLGIPIGWVDGAATVLRPL